MRKFNFRESRTLNFQFWLNMPLYRIHKFVYDTEQSCWKMPQMPRCLCINTAPFCIRFHPTFQCTHCALEGERAQLVGSLRRQVSLMAVRANARLILSRMESFVGPGAAEAARRRQLTLSLERQEARERQAQALSLSQGRNILRRGFFHVH